MKKLFNVMLCSLVIALLTTVVACGDSHTHDYKQMVTHATCTERGYTTFTCACGDSYVGNYVNSTGHAYNEIKTKPTCTQRGYTTYTCFCGDSYVGNYINPLEHSYSESIISAATCSQSGVITQTIIQ